MSAVESPRRARLRLRLADVDPELVLLDPESLDEAILGVVDDGSRPTHAVYSRTALARALARDMSPEDAEEWISYNVERSLPYMGPHAPSLVSEIPPEILS